MNRVSTRMPPGSSPGNENPFRHLAEGIFVLEGFNLFLRGNQIIFSNPSMNEHKCLTIAHRGFSGKAPENTLASFRKALEEKADGIELDVHQTKDGKIVVIHDASIDRTTNGKGLICEMTYEEIKKYDAGIKFANNFSGESVPLLEDVLQLVNGNATLYIEIKKGSEPYPGIEKKVLEILEQYNAHKRCVLHSFEKDTLSRINDLNDSIPLFQTIYVPPFMSSIYFDRIFFRSRIAHFRNLLGVNINHTAVDASLVNKIHHKKLKIIVWTVNNPSDIEKMKLMGVDGIISNFPDRVKNIK